LNSAIIENGAGFGAVFWVLTDKGLQKTSQPGPKRLGANAVFWQTAN